MEEKNILGQEILPFENISINLPHYFIHLKFRKKHQK